jgi:CheY-like chemotaxis protein
MSKIALVVDDSKSARFALRKFLEGFNYRVEATESALEAFQFLAHTLPDVIFLDHIMPVTDGFEVLRQVKTDSRLQVVPVVICSSNDGEEYATICRARGASAVLQKPPSTEQIAGLLANLVNRTASYEATLPPLKAEDYALAATLAPPSAAPNGVANAPRDSSQAMDKLMATIPPKLIPTAHLPSKAPVVTASPRPGQSEAEPPESVAPPRPDLKSALLLAGKGGRQLQDPMELAKRLQQTVMETVRRNIPDEESRPTVAPPPPVATTLAAMPSLASYSADGRVSGSSRTGADIDARLGKLTSDLFAEITALRAQLTALQGQSLPDEKVRIIAIEAAKSRTNALAQSLEQHLTALRNNIEAVLRAQNDRMQQIAGSIRQIAAEEARRALSRSAQDISQRTAESLARTLAPQLGNPPPSNET